MSHDVCGRDRVRYFTRPHTLPQASMASLARLAPSDIKVTKSKTCAPKVTSIGTQTMFRESGAQTDPCSITKANIGYDSWGHGPEVLSLEHLTYGQGLPVRSKEDLHLAQTLVQGWVNEQSDIMEQKKKKKKKRQKKGPVVEPVASERLIKIENFQSMKSEFEKSMSSKRKRLRMRVAADAIEDFSLQSRRLVKTKMGFLSRQLDELFRSKCKRMDRKSQQKIRALKHQFALSSSRLQLKRNKTLPLDLQRFQNALSREASMSISLQGHPECIDKRLRPLTVLSRQLDDRISRLSLSASQTDGNFTGPYLKRNQRYDKLLDEAYEEIQSQRVLRKNDLDKKVHKEKAGGQARKFDIADDEVRKFFQVDSNFLLDQDSERKITKEVTKEAQKKKRQSEVFDVKCCDVEHFDFAVEGLTDDLVHSEDNEDQVADKLVALAIEKAKSTL